MGKSILQGFQKTLDYDSIIVNSHEFLAEWPRADKIADKARMRLLKKAKKEGADPEHIKKLRKGRMAIWP